MCGRYLTPDQAAFERHWGLASPTDFVQSYNVAPSQAAPVIGVTTEGNVAARLMTWGFQPAWAKRAWINARAETARTSKAFADSTRRHRCLVPALGWYEWQGEAKPKQPYVLHLDGFLPIAFAGIWTARRVEDDWVRSFAILTRPALTSIARIHARMPVVLRPENYAAWMSRDVEADRAWELLSLPIETISSYRISTYVNKPEHDDAQCIQPVS